MVLSAKLDRLAVGSILRSKLVFLVNVRLRDMRLSRARLLSFVAGGNRSQHSAECVDIDNESNQVP